LADQYLEGWSAEVDGQPTKLYPIDSVFRGIVVGPGRHKIVHRYRTPGLTAGLISLALGLCLITLVAWRLRG